MSATPGPWRVDVREEKGDVIAVDIMKNGRRIGSATVRHDLPAIENARLITAAPDLLAALEEIAGVNPAEHTIHTYWNAVREIARAAIARATGEPETGVGK